MLRLSVVLNRKVICVYHALLTKTEKNAKRVNVLLLQTKKGAFPAQLSIRKLVRRKKMVKAFVSLRREKDVFRCKSLTQENRSEASDVYITECDHAGVDCNKIVTCFTTQKICANIDTSFLLY